MIREHSAKHPFVGSVVQTRFGNVVIITDKFGRKFMEYKFYILGKDPSRIGWIKLPFNVDPFSKYKFVRLATKKEIDAGRQGYVQNIERKAERVQENREHLHNEQIKPGDVVSVDYSNAKGQKEIVLEVNYRTGKLAIVRRNGFAAEALTKKRMLPIKICKKVADGGGKFDPNNPLYDKMYLRVPDFYKSGQTVAPRKPRPSWY